MEVDNSYTIGQRQAEKWIGCAFISVIDISHDFAVLQLKNHLGTIIKATLHESGKKSLEVPFSGEEAIILPSGEACIEIPLVGKIYFQGGGNMQFLFQIGLFEVKKEE